MRAYGSASLLFLAAATGGLLVACNALFSIERPIVVGPADASSSGTPTPNTVDAGVLHDGGAEASAVTLDAEADVNGKADVEAPVVPDLPLTPLPCHAVDVACGMTTTEIWAICDVPSATGDLVHRWTGAAWDPVAMPATCTDGCTPTAISVGKSGPWLVTSDASIYEWTGARFDARTGLAYDIGVGADGAVFAVGIGQARAGFEIYSYAGGGWAKTDFEGSLIDVDESGNPWLVDKFAHPSRVVGVQRALSGTAHDIGIARGDAGAVWVIGDTVPDAGSVAGHQTYRWSGQQFDLVENAGGERIAVDPLGRPVVVTNSGQIARYEAR